MSGAAAYGYENRVGCVSLRLQILYARNRQVGVEGSDRGSRWSESLWVRGEQQRQHHGLSWPPGGY